jgi:hypothetical protein
MRNFSQGIIEKSIIEGYGKDVMSVLLRANASENPRGRTSYARLATLIAPVTFTDRGPPYFFGPMNREQREGEKKARFYRQSAHRVCLQYDTSTQIS